VRPVPGTPASGRSTGRTATPQKPVAPRITLLTDFGTADGYVAAMKGVLAERAPGAAVDDATHEIAPGDVTAAALALSRYWRLYPPGTVHVAVVDPGVGSGRRALAGLADGRYLVAPDNGLLTRVLDEAADVALVAIENPAHMRHPVSATFHGRDIFAPAAAWLASAGAGRPDPARLAELGPAVRDPVRLPWPRPWRDAHGAAHGTVVHVDRFGNLITNLPRDWAPPGGAVRVDGVEVGPVRRTYADVPPGGLVALVGSAELLEVAVRDGSAAARLGKGRGAEVVVEGASG